MKLKTYRIIVLLVCCIQSVALAKPDTTRNNAESVLRIMSYNIRIASPPVMAWAGTDLAATAVAIKKYQPDLVALQEVDAFTDRSGKGVDQAKELGRLTGMYAHFAKAVDRSNGDYGVAVLSRFPIEKAASYRLSVLSDDPNAEVRGVAVITVQTQVGRVVLISAHLDHLSDRDRAHQIKQLNEIIKRYNKWPVLLGADLNTTPSNPVLQGLTKYLEIPCTDCLPTFPSDRPDRTLDYIMLNSKAQKRFRKLKYWTETEPYASDHLPLLLEVERR